jgi:hypothetical protein
MKTQIRVTPTPHTAILSEVLIPAVQGEFYSYDYLFDSGRPVFALLKCKSSKGRPVRQLANLGQEANMLFSFEGNLVNVHCIEHANVSGMLENNFENNFFGKTSIGIANIEFSEFHAIRDEQSVEELVSVCKEACSSNFTSAKLTEGVIFAVVTDLNKYGLFLVKKIDENSMLVNACHIML